MTTAARRAPPWTVQPCKTCWAMSAGQDRSHRGLHGRPPDRCWRILPSWWSCSTSIPSRSCRWPSPSTTSSMGRLTLNVLLSFAQFEREVIGERVRDKIAASKREVRVKTNRRDAAGLAKQLTAVWVPDERHEAMRDLSRAREAARNDLKGKGPCPSVLKLALPGRFRVFTSPRSCDGLRSWSRDSNAPIWVPFR
jgi:hypothetical protein